MITLSRSYIYVLIDVSATEADVTAIKGLFKNRDWHTAPLLNTVTHTAHKVDLRASASFTKPADFDGYEIDILPYLGASTSAADLDRSTAYNNSLQSCAGLVFRFTAH